MSKLSPNVITACWWRCRTGIGGNVNGGFEGGAGPSGGLL
ncbi:hypothetical protein A2U01_0096651, partial [Trifolium medium]|nr:hypothetical protein [Trifolium medium]